MKNTRRLSVTTVLILAVLVGAAIFAWSRFQQRRSWMTSSDGQTQSASSQALPFAPRAGIGDSSQEVAVSVTKVDHGVEVTLHIQPKWHVNANPASLAYLIPTTISIEQNGTSRPAAAQYPPGRNSGIRVDDRELQVYDDGTRILVSDLSERKDSRLMVHLQACSSDGVCLPPAHIAASVSTP
ncbi:protein-disulfide reductase DsbD domain-containing protein [Paraburkholderia fungorum]|uniref:protein-disulfide reductase DsbD domain-containing protein n=1 Tax=Paraburkholderia fungorum TaxID=134537 RepID=UPI003313A15B